MDKVPLDLPDAPIPESFLEQLEEHEKVESAVPMMAGFGSGDEELVFNFVVTIDGTAHPVVLHEDGDSGWQHLGTEDTMDEAMFKIQAWQEENGLTFGGPARQDEPEGTDS